MSTSDWTAAKHEYHPDLKGRCTSGWYNDQGRFIHCISDQKASVLHITFEGCWRGCCNSQADHNERHDHGGGDCMCFEMDYEENF
jgi:hypothetical protein